MKTRYLGIRWPEKSTPRSNLPPLFAALACGLAFVLFSMCGIAASQEAPASKSGGGGGQTSDISVTSTISDNDASGTAYRVQSDGLGPYVNQQAGVQSILQAAASYDWELSTYNSSFSGSAGRNAWITLGPVNQESASATLPSIWSSWGTNLEPVRFIDKCSYINVNMLAIKPGSPQACPILIRFGPEISSGRTTTYYRLDMSPNLCKSCIAEPETQDVQISCNAQDASGHCNDWSVDSIPPTSQSGGVPTNQVIARLVLVNSGGALVANDGDFYLTFHIHVTNP
ncbi:MAG TPA: hypothetical protein VJR03_02170 [Nitrospira sp.]|nr:hypothetical protein [Nitrospira sp.]